MYASLLKDRILETASSSWRTARRGALRLYVVWLGRWTAFGEGSHAPCSECAQFGSFAA